MFSGYKTYIVGTVTIISTIAAYLIGDAELADTIQLVVTALLGMTIRAGVAKTAE